MKCGYYDVFVKTCAKYPSNIAVRVYDNGEYKNYTYSELFGASEYISQNLQQLKFSKRIIGIVSHRNILIPCVIAAAHKCSTTFMFVDPLHNIEAVTKNVGITTILTINNSTENYVSSYLLGKKPDKTISVLDFIIDIYNCEPLVNINSRHMQQHSFIAMTSGSTGEPKHIQVPVQCLQPNIDDLTLMFNITPNDIIYFSTPLTFDPSMVEILLASVNGASLLIAPEKASILFPEHKENSVTVWQTTPSKFSQQSSSNIKHKILNENSSLRILALGGEPLNNMERLKELKHCNNKTKIFSMYGVTEMSCWACVAELNLDKILSDKGVPLGNCLSETELIIDGKEDKKKGNIILVSKTRKCVLLNRTVGNSEESSLKFIDTGDIGEAINGTIYYRGRRDDVIKRFGHKINLSFIESTAMLCPRVNTCSCLWMPKPKLLVVYFSSDNLSSQELSDFLKCKLDDKHWPDKIIRVENIPMNSHGKASKKELVKMFESVAANIQTVDSIKKIILKEIRETLGRHFVYDEIKDKDFFSIGGTSFLAVTMGNKLSVVNPKLDKLIVPYLVSQKNTIEEIIQIICKKLGQEQLKHKKIIKRPRFNSPDLSASISSTVKKKDSRDSNDLAEFHIVWSHDTGKCVDASPMLFHTGFNSYAVVGSHSGKVAVLDAATGELQGLVAVNSRIEASVLCYQEDPVKIPCGIVGSYNGTLVCFSLEPCKELWRVNIKSMIKSKAVCCKGLLYVASYDGSVTCINIMNGTILMTIYVTDEAISADLVLAKKEYVVLGTLSGVVAGVYTTTNMVAWRNTLGSPVFANPVLYDDDRYVIFAEVKGHIHCMTVEKGIKVWRYTGTKGNIFSSMYLTKLDKMNWQMIFGSHDKKVYCVNIKNFQPSLRWKTQLASAVYSTPIGMIDKFVIAVSNNGTLYLINIENGYIVKEFNLPNETFSSPAVYGNYIYIGCRDDHVYSIKCDIND